MAQPRISVVMTTIGDGRAFFDAYAKIAAGYPMDLLRIIVVPDRKTPASLADACASARASGLSIVCPTVAEQDELLKRLGAATLVPYDSDNRRNVGYLLAWMSGDEVVVSVDDDNFPLDCSFLGEHAIVASGPRPARVVNSRNGWWNPCSILEIEPMPVYPRGFPFFARTGQAADPVWTDETVDVRINAGLWLGDPDVDAITRMAIHPEVIAMDPAEAVLADGSWAPVNSQNTALHADAMPAYYFPRMGYRLGDQRFDRYADIFSGYFAQACAKHLGHAVRFGAPLVNHERNDHSLLRDLRQELYPLALLEDLLPWLRESTLDGSTYAEAYRSLSFQLQDAAEAMTGEIWTDQVRGFVHQMAHLMRQWTIVLDRAGREGL